MGEFRLAGAYVEARMDRTKLDAALSRLRRETLKVDVSADLTETSRRKVERDLDKLTADRIVRILASADTRVAADEIRNLTQRRRVRIGIDVDTRVAADDIANLTRRRILRVQAQANTEEAANSLRFLTRDRTVNIRTNMGGLGGLGSLGSSMGSAGASAGMLSSRFVALAGAALAALPAVASLGQALIQMGPAAALAAPALGSLITMGGALAVGLYGVGDAFKSAFSTGASTATSAASAARALEGAQINVARSARALKETQVDAARQIADAQKRVGQAAEDVRDAEVRAAADRKAALQRVADAEKDLADAQKDATRAQEDLNDARKTAAEQLEDLNNQLADAEIDQRQAVRDVQDAEKELAAVKAKGAAASASEVEDAQIAYDRAVQRLKEQQTETARLQDQTASANAAGVEGSATVRDAQDRMAAAQDTVAEKAKAVGDAQANAAQVAKDGAEAVQDAQEKLAEAQQGVADAQVAASRQVRSAQEALADANRAVAAAMAQGSAESIKFNDAMSKLSPNARNFVNTVRDLAPAWFAVRTGVQDALFRGLSSTLTRMSTAVLPSVRGGLVGMADVLNRTGTELMDTFTRLGNAGTLKRMFDGFTNGTKPLERIPGQLGQGFVQLSVAAAPAFQRLTTAMGGVADSVSQQLTQAFESGHLTQVIDDAMGIARQFVGLLGDIAGTVGNVLKAAAAGGGDALGAIGAAFKELRRITAMPEVQAALASIFTAVNAVAKLIAGTLGSVIQAVVPLLAALSPTITVLANALGPVLGQLASALGSALMPIIQALLPVVTMVVKGVADVAKAIIPMLGPIGQLIGAIVTALAPVLGVVIDAVVTLVGALATALLPVVTALIPVVQMVGQFLGQLAPIFPQLITALMPLLPVVGQLVAALLGLVMQVLQPILPLITMLAGLLAGMLADALGVLVPVIAAVVGSISQFVESISTAVKWVVDRFKWLYDVLVGHSIIPDLVNGIIQWFSRLWNKTKEIFTALKNGVVQIWNALWAAVRSKWDSFSSGIRNAISSVSTWLKNTVNSIRTSLSNTWTGLWNGVTSKVSSMISTVKGKFNEFSSAVKRTFSALRDGLGTIWNGIRSKFSAPVKFVVGTVYGGIRRMWNTIAGKISSRIVLPAISLGFNKGGIVPGSGNRDTVPAMLTPNERVLSNEQVARLGGHRAIDAMLGKDRSEGRTGGNPTQRQEERRQGAQHFADGGVVGTIQSIGGKIAGAVSSATDWAKNLVLGGLKSAAQKAISSLVRPLINRIPAGGVGNLMKGMSNRALDGILSWLGAQDKKAVGGPAVQRGLAWARTQAGKPYQWGGNGNPSWDCSGFVSAIESVVRGQSPHRRWATGSFHGATAPSGWVRNLVSPYMIGITNAGVGHTAGTIAGVNVESRGGGGGVIVGPRARSYRDSLFTDHYGFAPATKYDRGGKLPPGRTLVDNQTRRPERILDADHTAKLDAILANAAAGAAGVTVNMTVNSLTMPSVPERKQFATAMASEINEALRLYNRSRAR